MRSKKFVAQHYQGAGWKTNEVVKSMMEAGDFYTNESVQIKTSSLYKRYFVLVGDVGYTSGFTGAGATLTMAGAYMLVGEVCRHKGNLAAELRGYKEQMKPIIGDLQKTSSFVLTIFAPQMTWGIWLRNNIFAFIAWTRILEFVQKFFAGSFASTDKYGLPDYEWVA